MIVLIFAGSEYASNNIPSVKKGWTAIYTTPILLVVYKDLKINPLNQTPSVVNHYFKSFIKSAIFLSSNTNLFGISFTLVHLISRIDHSAISMPVISPSL